MTPLYMMIGAPPARYGIIHCELLNTAPTAKHDACLRGTDPAGNGCGELKVCSLRSGQRELNNAGFAPVNVML